MHRLAVFALLTTACSKAREADATDGLCTLAWTGDTGPELRWPALAGKPPVPAKRWRWINVWATYCKPCVDELPRLPRWQERLMSSGIAVDLTFVDVDADDGDIAAFRTDFPDTPMSLRLADPETGMPGWFAELGLTGSPTIPLQIFVAPSGKLRCVRAGSVGEADFPAVRALLESR